MFDYKAVITTTQCVSNARQEPLSCKNEEVTIATLSTSIGSGLL